MNGDTPGASSADDFDFLGPAISRRGEEGAETQSGSDEELAGPFIAGRPAGGEVPGSGPESSGGGEPQGAGDWRDDDLPWLIPADMGEDDPAQDTAADAESWRATGEVAEPDDGVEWGGEPVSLSEIGAEAEVARQGWDDAFGEPVAWDTGLDEPAGDAAPLDIASLEMDAGEEEREGFVVDAEPAGESWTDATKEAEGVGGMTGGAEAPWEAGRWDAAGEVGVEDGAGTESGAGGGAGWDAGEGVPEGGGLEAAGAAAEAGTAAWADAGAAAEAGGEGGKAGDALVEVADRLEGVARALREGRPLEVAADGDPLQLLVVGYALGYAQARRSGG